MCVYLWNLSYLLLWARIPHSQQKSPQCSTWVQSQKWQCGLSLFPNKWFNITVVQVYCPATDVEEAEVDQFYEDLQDSLVTAQSLSRVQLLVTPWTAAHQGSLSFTISLNLLKLLSVESAMPSNHLISVTPFSCSQSFPASGSFPMSQLFTLEN